MPRLASVHIPIKSFSVLGSTVLCYMSRTGPPPSGCLSRPSSDRSAWRPCCLRRMSMLASDQSSVWAESPAIHRIMRRSDTRSYLL